MNYIAWKQTNCVYHANSECFASSQGSVKIKLFCWIVYAGSSGEIELTKAYKSEDHFQQKIDEIGVGWITSRIGL